MKKFKRWLQTNSIYLITIIISLLLLIPAYFQNCIVYSILFNIGCSGVASAIMAIFINMKTDKDRVKKIQRAKKTYFQKLYDELIFIIQRILWFDERQNDIDFNWDLSSEEYSTLQYLLFSSRYPTEEISFSEALNRLKICSGKYSLEKMNLFSDEEKEKISKMFHIISVSGKYLMECINTIKQNEIILNIEDYLSLDKINSLCFNISLSLALMEKKNKNYSVAINLITDMTKEIRKECNYTGNIKIALMGSIPSSSL